MTETDHDQILGPGRSPRSFVGGHVDEELKQLDLAVAETRDLATEALHALRAPQAALRTAAADYIESVARRWVDASRRASVGVMAKLSDADVAELRLWADEQIALARSEVERDIESCDFWISETSGLSLTDVNTYGSTLVPRPKDSRSGIPQALVLLFEQCLRPLRRGLAAVGLASVPAEAELRLEATLVRAWLHYREVTIDCLVKWADIDDRYQASAARFQEMRWELAGEADIDALRAQRAAEDPDAAGSAVSADVGAAAALATASTAEVEIDGSSFDVSERVATDAIVRSDSETLVPIGGSLASS